MLAYLRAEGHEGEHVVDALDTGVADRGDIAPYARKRDHVVVIKDTDFLAMDERNHAGVFFIDDHTLTAYEIATAIIRAVDAIGDPAASFSSITGCNTRTRVGSRPHQSRSAATPSSVSTSWVGSTGSSASRACWRRTNAESSPARWAARTSLPLSPT